MKGLGVRYSEADGVPSWAVGKTADEILGMASQLARTVSTFQAPQAPQQPQAQTQMQGQYNPPQTQNALGGPPNAQLIYENPEEYQRQYDAYQEQRFQAMLSQAATPLLQGQAGLAKESSQRSPEFSDVWKRYGPEIESEVAGIPVHLRTVELYNKAAAIVRGAHWADFAREEAEKLAASGMGTERSAAQGSAPQLTSDALDQVWDTGHPFFENAKSMGMTKGQLREKIAKMGQTVDEFVANAQLGNLIQTKYGLQRASA